MSHITFAYSMSPPKETDLVRLTPFRREIVLSFQMGDAELASGLWRNGEEMRAGVRDMVSLYLFLSKAKMAGMPVFACIEEDSWYGTRAGMVDLVGRVAALRSDRRLRPARPEWEHKHFLATFSLTGQKFEEWTVLLGEEFRKDKHLVARRMLCAYVLARSAKAAGHRIIGFSDDALPTRMLQILLRHIPRRLLGWYFSKRPPSYAKDVCAETGVLQQFS